MRSLIRQFDKHINAQLWPIPTGPVVVFAHGKNATKITAGHSSAYSRDGPIIFHMRDGPPNVTGPPGGTGPPRMPGDWASGSAPPKTTDPPMDWLVRKKSLKKS